MDRELSLVVGAGDREEDILTVWFLISGPMRSRSAKNLKNGMKER